MSMAVMLFSCEKDDSGSGDEDDISFDFPIDDALQEKLNRNIYNIGDILPVSDGSSIFDNFSARFNSMSALDTDATIVAGDGIVFNASSLSGVLADASTFNALKNAYAVGALILMNGGTAADFARLCTALNCYNPYSEDEENLAADETPLWVLSGNLPGAEGIYCRLSPMGLIGAEEEEYTGDEASSVSRAVDATESNTLFTEYEQGLYCDYLVSDIKDALLPRNVGSPSSELTDLMSAVKVYIPGASTRDTPTSYSGKKWVAKTDNYMMELDIWNAYSAAEKRQYYFIHQEFTCSFKNTFVGEYKNAAWRGYGWYGKSVESAFKNSKEPASVIYHKLSPTTSTQTTTYTSSVSFSIGGQVVTGAGGLTGGVNISNSSSYNVEDVTISNQSVPTTQEAKAAWLFELRDASGTHKAGVHGFTEITPSSLSGRETMICGTDYIFSVPENCQNSWTLDYWVRLRRREFYSAFGPVKIDQYSYRHRTTKTFALPMVNPS